MPKSSCLKWTYGRPGIDYRVASLTASGIIPKCRKTSFKQEVHIQITRALNQFLFSVRLCSLRGSYNMYYWVMAIKPCHITSTMFPKENKPQRNVTNIFIL